jgi:2-polyprenyl-3-methyl-5-hydroxy-6-metoxy-1,4-benzoquinol methylase
MWERYGALDALSPASFHRRRLIRKLAIEFMPRAENIIDAGCGQGQLLVELRRALPGARLTGADVSAESRRQAALRCPEARISSLDLEGDGFDFDHEDLLSKFDLAVCSEVLEHLEHDRLAAARLARLLHPGGAAIVTVPGGKKSRFDELIGHRRHYTKRELRQVLESAGFRVERLVAWGFPFHNLYRSAVRVASRFAFKPAAVGTEPAPPTSSLADRAYALSGRLLKPLYYANRPYWGEQLIAVVRRP